MDKKTIDLKWHEDLVKDCKTITEETKLMSGAMLLKGKWMLGDRIAKDYHKFGHAKFGNYTQEMFAKELSISQQHVSAIVAFRDKIGDNFDTWMEENTDAVSRYSWRKIVHEWLVKAPRKKVDKENLDEILKTLLKNFSKKQVEVLVDRAKQGVKIYKGLGTILPLKELGVNIAKLEALTNVLTYYYQVKFEANKEDK